MKEKESKIIKFNRDIEINTEDLFYINENRVPHNFLDDFGLYIGQDDLRDRILYKRAQGSDFDVSASLYRVGLPRTMYLRSRVANIYEEPFSGMCFELPRGFEKNRSKRTFNEYVKSVQNFGDLYGIYPIVMSKFCDDNMNKRDVIIYE